MSMKHYAWMLEHRWDALATYNAERSRGLVHTPEWVEQMEEEQAKFEAETLSGLRAAQGNPVETESR